MHKRTFVVLVVGCLSGNYDGSLAQPRFQYPAEKLSLGPALYAQTWRVKDSTGANRVSAIFTPLRLSIPVTQNFDLDFYGASAFAGVDQGESQTLNGLVDTKIRGTLRLNDYHWLVQAGVNLPTGKNVLAADEAQVNNLLAETVLGFLFKRYGRGLDFDAGVAYAWSLSEKTKTGLGVAYLRKGGYLFRQDDSRRFQPGDEFSVTAGLETQTERLRLRSHVLAKFFQKDQLEGRTVFQEGAQIEINGEVGFPLQKWRFVLAAKDVIKANNRTFSTGGQSVAASKDNFPGNIFWLNQQTTYPVSEKFSVTVSLGLNSLGKSDLQLGDAQIFNFGAGTQLKLSERLIAQTTFSYSTGEAKDAAGQAFDLQGIFINTGLMLRY